MRFPFSFIKSGAAPAAHDPATDNLSLWLRTDSVSGTGATLSWASKASAGSSGSATALNHNTGYGDTVVQPSTALNGHSSVLWGGAYPLLEGIDGVRALLGAGDSTPASYTVAYVLRPLSSNAYALSGGKVDWGNPGVFASAGGNLTHAIMDDDGTCKVGVRHYNDDTAAGGGTTPVVWPGGFGAWGLMWISYTSGGNIRIRINGTDYIDEPIESNQGPAWSDAITYMGTMGGGAFVATFELVELMIFPGQALVGAALTLREQGYFGPRYSSLGL